MTDKDQRAVVAWAWGGAGSSGVGGSTQSALVAAIRERERAVSDALTAALRWAPARLSIGGVGGGSGLVAGGTAGLTWGGNGGYSGAFGSTYDPAPTAATIRAAADRLSDSLVVALQDPCQDRSSSETDGTP